VGVYYQGVCWGGRGGGGGGVFADGVFKGWEQVPAVACVDGEGVVD